MNLASGHPINVTLHYADGQSTLTLADTVINVSFATNLNVGNMTNLVGGPTAYVGFTGADGGIASTQTITNFSFVSLPTAVIALIASNVVISWHAAIPGYMVQTSTNLALGNWVTLTKQPAVVNGQNQVILPVPNVNTFYRLVLP